MNAKVKDSDRRFALALYLDCAPEDLESTSNPCFAYDGRGHFLSTYDGHENEFKYEGRTFYIYRVN
jgi:hypothetical protein